MQIRPKQFYLSWAQHHRRKCQILHVLKYWTQNILTGSFFSCKITCVWVLLLATRYFWLLFISWLTHCLGFVLCVVLWPEFIIEYEDAMHEAGLWRHQAEVSGTQTTAQLKLSPYVNYSFRVMAENSIGRSVPSEASEQYLTKAAGKAGTQEAGRRPEGSPCLPESWSLLMWDCFISRTRPESHGCGRTRDRAGQLGDHMEGESGGFFYTEQNRSF